MICCHAPGEPSNRPSGVTTSHSVAPNDPSSIRFTSVATRSPVWASQRSWLPSSPSVATRRPVVSNATPTIGASSLSVAARRPVARSWIVTTGSARSAFATSRLLPIGGRSASADPYVSAMPLAVAAEDHAVDVRPRGGERRHFPSRRGVEHLDRGLVLVLRDERELRPVRTEHHARRPQQILGLGLRLPHALAGLEVGRRDRVGRPGGTAAPASHAGEAQAEPAAATAEAAHRDRDEEAAVGAHGGRRRHPAEGVLRSVELQVAQLFAACGIRRDGVALLLAASAAEHPHPAALAEVRLAVVHDQALGRERQARDLQLTHHRAGDLELLAGRPRDFLFLGARGRGPDRDAPHDLVGLDVLHHDREAAVLIAAHGGRQLAVRAVGGGRGPDVQDVGDRRIRGRLAGSAAAAHPQPDPRRRAGSTR